MAMRSCGMPSARALMSAPSKKVVLVVGAGAGIGGNVARRFAREGFHAVLCRRSDDLGLQRLVAQIHEDGGSASGRLINVAEESSIEALVEDVEMNVGPIHTAVYNIGAQIGDRPLEKTSLKMFELGWRLATFGLFRLAVAALPRMVGRGGGALLVTSATAAVRGSSGQSSHSSAMAGRRMLCQTLNAEYARKGVHVVHVIIDVDAPDTLGKMLGPAGFQQLREARGLDKAIYALGLTVRGGINADFAKNHGDFACGGILEVVVAYRRSRRRVI